MTKTEQDGTEGFGLFVCLDLGIYVSLSEKRFLACVDLLSHSVFLVRLSSFSIMPYSFSFSIICLFSPTVHTHTHHRLIWEDWRGYVFQFVLNRVQCDKEWVALPLSLSVVSGRCQTKLSDHKTHATTWRQEHYLFILQYRRQHSCRKIHLQTNSNSSKKTFFFFHVFRAQKYPRFWQLNLKDIKYICIV